MITFSLKQRRIGDIMLLLLFLVPINPHLSCLFLTSYDLAQVRNLLIQLLFCSFKFPFFGLPFGVELFILS